MLKISEIIEAIEPEVRTLRQNYSNDSILVFEHDTRRITGKSLYIAIKGERLDGHDFLNEAHKKGAVCAIVEKYSEKAPAELVQLVVKDSVESYGKLATYWRKKFKYPIIAITGSNGKTTTKDVLYAILSAAGPTSKNDGNFNNHIGVPYTLLKFAKDNCFGIVEMGMNHKGEIKYLAEIAEPDLGIITNIGTAHIGLLGSQEEIFKAKHELFDNIISRNKKLIVNASDPYLRRVLDSGYKNIASYSVTKNIKKADADVVIFDYEQKGINQVFKIYLKQADRVIEAKTSLLGLYNLFNIAAGICTALTLGLDIDDIIKAVQAPVLSAMRSKIEVRNGVTIIVDCYNANPDSMKAAIKNISEMNGFKRKVAVLGDMLELETFAHELHTEVGVFAAEQNIEHVFAYGNFSEDYKSGYFQWTKFMDSKSVVFNQYKIDEIGKLKKDLFAFASEGDLILLKGSRGMKLERVLE